jgi:hypothetical protein
MELTGLSQGKEVGRLKKMLDQRVLDGELLPDDKDSAKQFVLDNL